MSGMKTKFQWRLTSASSTLSEAAETNTATLVALYPVLAKLPAALLRRIGDAAQTLSLPAGAMISLTAALEGGTKIEDFLIAAA